MGDLIRFKGGENYIMNIFDIAKAFLSLDIMTHKKLQKLCYYAQAWHLALFKEPLYKESLQAWIHGPVCRDLYQEYKKYGWRKIPSEKKPCNVDGDTYEFIKEVYVTYGELSGDELEMLTHEEEPWIEARGDLSSMEPSYEEIKLSTMQDYYWSVYEGGQND